MDSSRHTSIPQAAPDTQIRGITPSHPTNSAHSQVPRATDHAEHPEIESNHHDPEVSLLQPPKRPSMTTYNAATTDVQVDELPDYSSSLRSPWTPFWLRTSVLISFALIFTLCWIALVILWYQTEREQGLALTLSHNHYAWTYGPTAILVVIVSLWRQVDYACKSIQPWQELKSPTPATKSLLLDYVSPLQITSFTASIRNQHWTVTATITAFAILKLITLFSTVLFISLPTTRTGSVTVNLATSFNGSNIWPGIVSPDAYSLPTNATYQYQLDDTRTYLNLSSSPVYSYLSMLQGDSGDPLGTQGNLAFQIFQYDDEVPNVQSVMTEVDIFEALVDCEPAEVSYRYPVNTTMEIELEIDTPTCHLGYNYSSFTLFLPGTAYSSCLSHSFLYSLDRRNCSIPSPITLFDFRNQSVPTDQSVGGDYRIVLSSLNITQGNNTKVDPFCGDVVQSASVVVCKVDYNMTRGDLTTILQDDSFNIKKGEARLGSQLKGLQSLQLTELILSTLFTARAIFGSLLSTGGSIEDAFFGLMAKSQGSQHVQPSDLIQFTDAELMSNVARKVFEGLAVQVVRSHALESDANSTTATSVYIEDRLHIRNLSLWFMVAGFILLSILSLIVMILSPKCAIPRNPGPNITSAAILSQSPRLNKLLRKLGLYRNRFLTSQLENTSFHTEDNPHFSLTVDMPDHYVPRKGIWQGFWTPIPLRTWMLALTLIPPLILIVVLEILFQKSERDEGLATVLDGSSSASSTLRYGSTLVMLLVATAFNALDFQITVFAPFQKLRSGDTSGSLVSHLLGQTPLFALYQSLRYQYYGAFFSNLAGLIGSVLTVIVSGLWVVGEFSHANAVTGNTASTWDWTWSQSVLDDGGAAFTLNSLERSSVGNTTGVWDDLAFPLMVNLTANNSNSTGNFSLSLPALRPVLDCNIIPSEDILIYNTTQPGPHAGSSVFVGTVSAYIELPSGCHGGPYGNQSFTYFNQSLWSAGTPEGFRTAILTDLHLGPWPITKANNLTWLRWGETGDNLQQPDNPGGCPSIGIIMGYLNTDSTPSQNITAAFCYQRTQQIQTQVRYEGQLQHNLIDPNVPPVTDESTAFYVTNGSEGVTAFPYRIEGHLLNNLTFYDQSQYDTTYDGNPRTIDPFFDHIISGPLNVSFDEMFSNSSRLLEAADLMYRKYMVQVIAAKFRPAASAGSGMSFTGTSIETISRLQVNETSKIVLQIMLGVMVLLGLLAITTSKIRNVLPHNPCSIAGNMALFAGSDLCEKNILPEDAAYMTDKEYKQHLDGYLFSLGWWEETTGSRLRRRFGIDVGKSTALAPDESKQPRFRGLHRRKAKA